MLENINEKSWQSREIYAKFGLAIHNLQCLETGLVNLMIALKLKNRDETTRKEIEELMEKNYKKTLGILINNLKKDISFSDELENEISEILELRNFLVHRYFRKRCIDFIKDEGKKKMLSELNLINDKISKSDKKIDEIISGIRKKYGITDKMIMNNIKELLENE